MKLIYIFILVFISQGCEEEPITGLERGWIWTGLLGEDEEETQIDTTAMGELQVIGNNYDGTLKIFKGYTTESIPVLELYVDEGDILSRAIKQGRYTVQWIPGSTYNAELVHDECTRIETGKYSQQLKIHDDCN